ncbi:hypothetical protein [Mycolicibacterium wolinskyi]|uniref:hypothetical protein n=1 Tax=Mycolicibacterium wolinskyi TaxID=59750 RepID=UPI003917A216
MTRPAGGPAALWTTIDQLLSSTSNALLLFVLAQVATVSEFGVVSLQIAIVMAWIGFNRGAVGTPVLLVSNLSKREILAEGGYATAFSILSGTGAVMAILAVGWAAGDVAMAVALGVVIPVVLAQDVARYPAIASGRPLVAVVADAAWALGMAGLFAANIAGAGVSVETAILLWGALGLLSATVLVAGTPIRPHLDRIGSWWKMYSPARIRFGATYATVALSTAATAGLVTVIAGADIAGGLRGASSLFGPIMMLIMAVPMVFVPHVRRTSASPRAQWRLLVKTSSITSTLAIAATALVMAVPTPMGGWILGQTWESAVTAVPFIGLECAANCWIVGLYSWLQAQGMGRKLFQLRALHVSLQLGAAAVAALAVGTLVAVASALAVSCWLMALIGLVVVGRASRRQPTTRPAPQAPSQNSAAHDPARPWPTIDVLDDELVRTAARTR